METSKIKNAIIVLLFICIGIFATCEFTKQVQQVTNPISQDTIFLSQWRREKQEKLNLITYYEQELTRLQHDNDSMQVLVTQTKTLTSVYRFKAKHFEQQLKEAISSIAPKDNLTADSISPILDSLIASHKQSDTACDETINVLENLVINRDSSILFQKQIENNLRNLGKEQELRNQYLTEQLNTAFKAQKKKSRQNKLLSGGLLILSGITTSILLTQSLK